MEIQFTNRKSRYGFTIIEMIVAILLMTILGVVVISRFADSNSLNADVVRDIVVSMSRTALQNSLGRSSVTLTITPSAGGDEATIETSDAGGTIRSETVSLRSITLSGDINITDSCEVTPGAANITNAAPMTISFGTLGDLGTSGVTGSTGAVTSAVRICINNIATDSVCVSPSGFAYAGDCDV